jgi:hypothetical protein
LEPKELLIAVRVGGHAMIWRMINVKLIENHSEKLLALNEVGDLTKLPNDGSIFLVLLNFGVLEVLDEIVEALQTCIGEIADLNERKITFSLLNLAHFLPWKCS